MNYDINQLKELLDGKISEIYLFDEIDSTNTEARRRGLNSNQLPALFAAERQTAGRGRMGRSFYSPKSTGIYATVALPTKKELADTLLMTTASAVAICSAIKEVTGISTEIKWVNDLYLGGKKASGILCEFLPQNNIIIVGFGINLTTEDFPEELKDTATSLGLDDCDETLRARLLAVCTLKLIEVWDQLEAGAFIDEYIKNSMVIGKNITYRKNGVTHRAHAYGIDKRGRLLVREEGREHILSSGEITLRLD